MDEFFGAFCFFAKFGASLPSYARKWENVHARNRDALWRYQATKKEKNGKNAYADLDNKALFCYNKRRNIYFHILKGITL